MKYIKQHRLFLITLATLLIFVGCGTDAKPTYFMSMFRDDGDINRLSECLVEPPQVDDTTITVKSNKQCLVDLSNRDTSDPNVEASFTEILNDPIIYLDRIVTFTATIKNVRGNGHDIDLYTNKRLTDFKIYSHGADVFILNEKGEEVDLVKNQKYKFQVRIYQIRIDDNANWLITSEFIISEDKKVIHQPQFAN